MIAPRLLFPRSLVAIAAVLTIFATSACQKPPPERRIEIWISSEHRPEVSVQAGKDYWSHGSGADIFNADIGPKFLQEHTVLKGELAWHDRETDQARLSFSLKNEKPVTVVIREVSPTSAPLAEKEARRTLFYPPGLHTFKELLFVQHTYD